MVLKMFGYILLVTAMASVCSAAEEKPHSSMQAEAAAQQSQSSPPIEGHHIQVLLLSSKSGKPVRNAWVGLWGVAQNGETSWLKGVRTDSQGFAEFNFVDTIPERITLSFEANEFDSCSETRFLTERIIKTGTLARNFVVPAKLYASRPPRAGQLVVYGRAVTAGDRIGQAIRFLQLFF